MALLGLLGLIFLVIVWNGWLSPIQQIPRSLEMIVSVSPLLFFVRGLLYGRYSTHVQVAFPAIIYLIIGTWYSLTPKEEIYGYLLIIFSFMLYLGGFLYARTIMKHEKEQQEIDKTV
jgi:uncharacterized membrane protein